jgi:hypothetical protein
VKPVRPFKHAEAGDDARGWVAVSLFGLCAWGPNRQAAWDLLVHLIEAAAIEEAAL